MPKNETRVVDRRAIVAGLSRFGRALATAAKVIVGLCLVLGTAAATGWGGYRLARTSSHFSLSHLSVDSSTRMSDWVVARAAGVKRGDNLIALDLRAAEKRLSDDPWVRSVRMTRKLPSSLEIQLEENEAAALASLDGDIFLVGVDGVPFKAWEEGDPHDLPMLTGVTGDAIARDRAGAVERLAAGLAVIAHYARLPVSRVQPAQEVHLSPDGAVILTVGVHGVALHLGENPGPRKFLMVAEVLDMFTKKRRLPGVVFLDNHLHPERVVVRMR